VAVLAPVTTLVIVWHAVPDSLHPATMNQVGDEVTHRARSKDCQHRVLLDGAAHSAAVTAHIGQTVPPVPSVPSAGLVSVLRQIGCAARDVADRLCGLFYEPLRRAWP